MSNEGDEVHLTHTVSPWMPEQDRLILAVLGKLAEECNELAGRAARSIIQGLDELDPASGLTNRVELAREAGDVEACIAKLEEVLGIGASPSRVAAKYDHLGRWHNMIREREAAELADLARQVFGSYPL